MKKLIVVAYSFPPVGGAGVQRPVKFVKYLPSFGWDPVVLTVANPSVPLMDQGLTKDIPAGIRIYRARSLEPSYQTKQTFADSNPGRDPGVLKRTIKRIVSGMLLPDLQVLWWPGLVRELWRVVRLEKPQCIYVTAPPFSSFLPVVLVGKILGVPVVLDYRDEWVFSRTSWEHSSKSPVAQWIDRNMERLAVRNCAAFTTATQSYVSNIGKHYGTDLLPKGTVITNGFDADDFAFGSGVQKADHGQVISIVYAGTVWRATSLEFFCKAIEALLTEQPDLRTKVRIKVFGRVVDSEKEYLQAGLVGEVTECHGYVDHEKVVLEMLDADMLLLTLTDLPGAERIMHGKVFEYMASGKHILALIPDGEVKSLLMRDYSNSTIVHPNDGAATLSSVKDLVANIDDIRARKGNDVSAYLRKNLTGRLAGVLDGVVASRPVK